MVVATGLWCRKWRLSVTVGDDSGGVVVGVAGGVDVVGGCRFGQKGGGDWSSVVVAVGVESDLFAGGFLVVRMATAGCGRWPGKRKGGGSGGARRKKVADGGDGGQKHGGGCWPGKGIDGGGPVAKGGYGGGWPE